MATKDETSPAAKKTTARRRPAAKKTAARKPAARKPAIVQPAEGLDGPEPVQDPRDAQIQALLAAVADLQARAGVAAPNYTGAPASVVVPGPASPAPPSHAMSKDLDDTEAGDICLYVVPSTSGGDPLSGYGLVVAVVEADDETGGDAVDGRPSHTALVVAPLPVLGMHLTAANIVDVDTSEAIQRKRAG
jgi:hypothetical protein